MNKNYKKQTAAQKVFSTHTIHITNMILEKFGPSYATKAEVRITARRKIPYAPEVENFIIFQTKMFIRFLDSRNSDSTNPQFLNALTNLMADYLSAYTMHNHNIPTRKKAKEILKHTLYDNSSYIQKLLARQEMEREARDKRRNNVYKKSAQHRKNQKNKDAQKNFYAAKAKQSNQIIEIVIRKR